MIHSVARESAANLALCPSRASPPNRWQSRHCSVISFSRKAARNQSPASWSCALWQDTQPLTEARFECLFVKSPASMIELRASPPIVKVRAIIATTRENAKTVKMLRRLLRERVGQHGGWVWAQVPSEPGPPSLHGPPYSADRRHSQRSPSLAGVHSLVPPHRPDTYGPNSHGLFHSQARPQRNLLNGR